MSKLRIAIDFRTEDPRQGVGTAVLALAFGLSRVRETDQEYVFIVLEKNKDFFLPHISGPCSLVTVAGRQDSRLGKLKNKAKKIPFVQRAWLALHRGDTVLPASDGTAERLGCNVVHFPAQTAYTTDLPTIYQPWDLQFCHYPEFFSPEDRLVRAAYYGGFCRRAACVCVQTEWTKQDVVSQFSLSEEKVAVIRWGTAFEAYRSLPESEMDDIRINLHLPETFFLYPAVTWPHKNHEQILRALAVLKKNRGLHFHVVFTGAITEYGQHLQTLAKELGVSEQVQFLGYLSERQIQTLFHLARALLFPSRFEGLGLPVLEAFRVGLPVISSSASVLPEVTAGAALLVHPDSPELLAQTMERVDADQALREQMVSRGAGVLRDYSADAAAMQFRALYQATAKGHQA